jgi:hypothetical protein
MLVYPSPASRLFVGRGLPFDYLRTYDIRILRIGLCALESL